MEHRSHSENEIRTESIFSSHSKEVWESDNEWTFHRSIGFNLKTSIFIYVQKMAKKNPLEIQRFEKQNAQTLQ